MFTLSKLFGPQIAYGSSGGGSGGGGGGGGGSSRSSSSQSRSRRTAPKPKPKPAPKPKSSGGGKGSSKPKSTSKGRNRDADMYAGSRYKKQADGSYKSNTSVSAKDLKSGNVTTYKAKNNTGSITVARGTKFEDVPQVGTKPNSQVYNNVDVASPTKQAPVQSGGSSAPVTAPEKISPQDGVGGGRDGGGSAKRKASNVNEDNIRVKRQAQGVDKYKNTQTASIKQAGERRRKNSMKITKST